MLKNFQEIKIQKQKNKLKARTWTKCPCCGNGELLVMGADHLCFNCDWSNSRMLVDSGHMDDLGAAAKNQFLTNANIYIQITSKDEIGKVETTPVAS